MSFPSFFFSVLPLLTAAGGAASTGPFRGGITNVLDLVPKGIHDKCPVIIGCKRDVDRVIDHYK
jgi:fructose-1,6-bisphosphatase I